MLHALGPLLHSELQRPGCPPPAAHQPQRPLHCSHEATDAQLSAWHAFRSPQEAVSQDCLPSELTLNSIAEIVTSVRSISKQLMPSSPCAWCDQSKDPSPSPPARIRNVTDPCPSSWHQPCVQVSCEVPHVASAQSSSTCSDPSNSIRSRSAGEPKRDGTRCPVRMYKVALGRTTVASRGRSTHFGNSCTTGDPASQSHDKSITPTILNCSAITRQVSNSELQA